MAVTNSSLKKRAGDLRDALGLSKKNILFGRFSRPDPNKWTPLVLDAFHAAHCENPQIRLLLREPPAATASSLVAQNLAVWFPPSSEESSANRKELSPPPIMMMPAAADPRDLMVSQFACDVVLHTSSIGESFGYGIAEPMALGKPVITHSTPWQDQAQLELCKHGNCGLIASTAQSMRKAILRMAEHADWRLKCGGAARNHILALADTNETTGRLEAAMRCAVAGAENPHAQQDLQRALVTAKYLKQNQWGDNIGDQIHLRSFATRSFVFRGFRFLKRRLLS